MAYHRCMRIRAIGLLIAFLSLALAADLPTLEPKDLAAQLSAKGAKATLIHVGFPVMYRGRHIPASIYAGSASKSEGLDALKAAAEKLPRSRQIVVYCGCCPFD